MKRRKLKMNIMSLIECTLYFNHLPVSNQSFVYFLRNILFSWILLLPLLIIMTDIFYTRDGLKVVALLIVWIICLTCVGVIICSLRCYICYSERPESHVSSHIPDCPSKSDEEIDGQFEKEETALWGIGVCFRHIWKKVISRFVILLQFWVWVWNQNHSR